MTDRKLVGTDPQGDCSFQSLLVEHLTELQSFLNHILSDRFLNAQSTLDETIRVDPNTIIKTFLSAYTALSTSLITSYHSNSINFDYLTFLKEYVERVEANLNDPHLTNSYDFKNAINNWITYNNVQEKYYSIEETAVSELQE